MTTIYHTPGNGTTPYTGEISGYTLTITYVNTFDGSTSTTVRLYEKQGGLWKRTVNPGGEWRRVYTPKTPPTTPPSGTYVVAEWTGESWSERESGTYHE